MIKIQENGRIVHQEEVARETFRLRLECPKIARSARPGQFVMLQVREGMDPLLRRPFSFHRIFAEEGVIEILYRIVGRGTMLLSRRRAGARASVVGPLGNGFRLPAAGESPILLVAGGIGVAPLFELTVGIGAAAAEASAGGGDVRLFYGARTAAELLPDELLAPLGVTVHFSTDDGTRGHHGYVPQLLQQVVREEELRPALVYACGPLAMQYHVAKWALAESIPAQLSLESLMACGLSACLGCALPAADPASVSTPDPASTSGAGGSDAPVSQQDRYVHVCKDGPIFSAGSIQWNKIRILQSQPPISLCS